MAMVITGSRSSVVQAAVDAPPVSGWVLTWSDEFDGSGVLNSADWDYEEGYMRNSEAQY